MRLAAGGLVMVLTACSSGAADQPAPDPASMIECALASAQVFARDCSVEHAQQDGTPLLIIHHPDGGFRRLEVLADGRGVAAADGADTAKVSMRESGIEVALGNDRYRLPATLKQASTANVRQ